VPKFVISSTVEDPEWNNSIVMRGDLGETVATLRQWRRGDVVVRRRTRPHLEAVQVGARILAHRVGCIGGRSTIRSGYSSTESESSFPSAATRSRTARPRAEQVDDSFRRSCTYSVGLTGGCPVGSTGGCRSCTSRDGPTPLSQPRVPSRRMSIPASGSRPCCRLARSRMPLAHSLFGAGEGREVCELEGDDDLSAFGAGIGRLPGANLRLESTASKDRSPSVEFAREAITSPSTSTLRRAGSDGRWE
jgi:hypothetical protein